MIYISDLPRVNQIVDKIRCVKQSVSHPRFCLENYCFDMRDRHEKQFAVKEYRL